MGFSLKKLVKGVGNAISKPIRGIGRVARGVVTGNMKKIGQGIGDIGDGAKTIGKGVAFVNPALGGALVAAGGLAGKGNDPGGFKKWKPFKESVIPGASTYAIGRIAKGVFNGGGAGAAGGNVTASPVGDFGSVTGAITNPTNYVAPKLTAIGRIGKVAGDIGKFVVKNPELSLNAAGMAMQAYGEHQAGQMEDEMLSARSRAWEAIRRNRAAMGMSV